MMNSKRPRTKKQHEFTKLVLCSFSVAILVLTVVAVVKSIAADRNDSNESNLSLQQNCINDVDSGNKQSLSMLYELAKLPGNSAEPSLVTAVNSQVNREHGCYTEYPVSHAIQEENAYQQQCVNNATSFYSQFVNLAKAQMLDPPQFPDAPTYMLSFQQAQTQAENNCRLA